MRFEWDEAKNRGNFKKHGIGFEAAMLVFDDPHAFSDLDRIIDDEERWQTLGRDRRNDHHGGAHVVGRREP